jgi:hypothetical protein
MEASLFYYYRSQASKSCKESNLKDTNSLSLGSYKDTSNETDRYPVV